MKKKIWITIGAVFFLFCVYTFVKQMLPEKVDPNKYLADDNGYAVKDPQGNYYLPYAGESGETREDTDEVSGEKTYYVSGVWLWNDILEEYENAPDGVSKIADLNFKTAQHEQTALLYEKGDMSATLYYSDVNTGCAYIYNYGWLDPTTRLMNCGTEQQQVSEAFYRFLIANATPATKEDYVGTIMDYLDSFKECTLSGYWVWNEDIMLEEGTQQLSFDINGSFCDGDNFFGFTVKKQTINDEAILSLLWMGKPDWPAEFTSWIRDAGWNDYRERYINLGEEEQIVTADTYKFFTSNAKPCTKEEFDAMATKDYREIEYYSEPLEGKHEWNVEVSWLFDETAGNEWGQDQMQFVSAGENYTAMWGKRDPETELYSIYYGNGDELTLVYTSENGWIDEKYRNVEFEQPVYVLFEVISQLSYYCQKVVE